MRPELLFVSPRFLFPVDSGGKIRTTQILRGLKGGAFRITLVSPATREQRRDFTAELATVCDEFVGWDDEPRGRFFHWLRLRHAFARWPIPVMTDRTAVGERAVRPLLDRRPAVAVFDFPHAALLAPATIPVPTVMFTHNVEAEIFARHVDVARNPLARWLWSDQHRKMVRFEREALRRFDTVIAVSRRDAEQLRAAYGIGNVAVINTGVDLDYFSWSAPGHGDEVIFSGSMDWLANQDGIAFFMDEVWPLIVRARPLARMTVVGRTPPQSLVEAVRSRGLNWLFTGYVDDIRPFIRGASVYVIPLRVGGGTRLKVFEAMGLGCPVVSTTVGVEGLPLEPETHYLRAEAPEPLAQAVVRLLGDAELRERLSRTARAHVEANFSYRSVAAEFERICADTAARTRGRESAPVSHGVAA